MNSQRQDIIENLKNGFLKINTINGYTRNVSKVTYYNLVLSDITSFKENHAQVDFEPGADIIDDTKNETTLKNQFAILIKTFIESKTDINKEGLLVNEAEEWIKNWEWFFYGINKDISRDNICNLRSVAGVYKYTIIARDPVFAKAQNKQTVAILLRVYFNQFKSY